MIAPGLRSASRIVVKIGSALLVDAETQKPREGWLEGLARQIVRLKARGQEVIVVTSGAVASGRPVLGLPPDRKLRLEEKQAAAACGQIRLAYAYAEALGAVGLGAAQILVSPGDTEHRRRHLNARATVETLLRLGAVPVINENDSVATAELRIGDNDRLAARVAQMCSADTLVLLSDIDGLYTADPRRDASATHIPVVEQLSPQIMGMAQEARSGVGTGGMVTKLMAAQLALAAGCRMVIAHGLDPAVLEGLDRPTSEGGVRATWFLPAEDPPLARKRWIAAHLSSAGRIAVDAGAAEALRSGRSLLPAGVSRIEGRFSRGDVVIVEDPEGRALARGLVAYDSDAAQRIMGRHSSEIERILGYSGREEMIHRDDLAML